MAASSNCFPKTALFSEFMEYFETQAREIGTMVGRRNSRFFKQPQFEKLFPGCAYHKRVAKGTLYCIVNRKHGVEFTDGGTTPNHKLKCSWSIPFKFDLDEMVYVVLSTAPTYCPDHSHTLNRHNIRASARRLISYEKEMTPGKLLFVTNLVPFNPLQQSLQMKCFSL